MAEEIVAEPYSAPSLSSEFSQGNDLVELLQGLMVVDDHIDDASTPSAINAQDTVDTLSNLEEWPEPSSDL